ncbi:hypothetical protein X975_20067, partial [Stegodyphus mimosarum]
NEAFSSTLTLPFATLLHRLHSLASNAIAQNIRSFISLLCSLGNSQFSKSYHSFIRA